MLIFLILTVIGGTLGFLKARSTNEPPVFQGLAVILGVCISWFLALAISGIAFVKMPHVTQYHEFDKLQIVALGNSNEMRGDFFLGCGIINSRPTYSFYYLLSDGGKQLDTLDASLAVVYEEDRSDAYLVKTGTKEVHSARARLWFIPSILYGDMKQGKYAIHVPRGTIKTGYKLGVN